MSEYERKYDEQRDAVTDFTTDELLDAMTRIEQKPTPLSVDDIARRDAIREELKCRSENSTT